MNAHFEAAKTLLFEGNWCLRQDYNFNHSKESFTVTDGEDELTINNGIFSELIALGKHKVIVDDKGPYGHVKLFTFTNTPEHESQMEQ